ncbi:nudix hydrolase 20, chloroplastic isoform X2 [Cryptomeria japonica]|uniref:nudix hydrolase 20, chloroplastic isoform X2 n=1 Tax=Cryptomeria japonica TaxID=3369 RepID=UPI0025AD528E|nr:nudix hydrolase 20, chloroplastic isoform X2 [Cryptomeria japonica]
MGTKLFSPKITYLHSRLMPHLQFQAGHSGCNVERPFAMLNIISRKTSRRNCSVRASGISIEEMLSIGQLQDQPPVDLEGFMDKVSLCNRGIEKKSEFLPFVVEKNIVGYIHPSIVEHLKQFEDVFTIQSTVEGQNAMFTNETHINSFVTLHHQLKTADERTEAVGVAIKWLNKAGIILGLRNELNPVVLTFGGELLFSLERAAVPYFGTKAYGVHMNGYVNIGGEKSLWIGKRSETKSTFPGMLDHLVAGGLPKGITCKENMIKECSEEAGIPRNVAEMAVPVGAVSYEDIYRNCFKRDVLFCYDLLLPHDFRPRNIDGEVERFMLVPVSQVANVIYKTKLYKPNCSLVIIDFFFRHGSLVVIFLLLSIFY